MGSHEQVDEINRLIRNHRRRLQILKEQEALQGISVDPKILLEIEDIETKILELQSQLDELVKEDETNIPANSSSDIHSSTQDGVFKEKTLKKRLLSIVRDPIWQVAGIFISILAFILSIYTFSFRDPAKSTIPPTQPSETTPNVQLVTNVPIINPENTKTPEPISIPTATPTSTSFLDVYPTPTPIPVSVSRPIPPPSPAPGIPPGPTQAELEEEKYVKCLAASFEDWIYNPARENRIIEPDSNPVQVQSGFVAYRGWYLKNIGTCTWGSGYELAFYGGHPMNFKGFKFSDTIGPDDAGDNVIHNQGTTVPRVRGTKRVALEAQLEAPLIPGIYPSYWRMRNPEGEYFGPIIGVTFEVVDDCEVGIYGSSPVINKFEILGVGNVFNLKNPLRLKAKPDEPITLVWSIIESKSYELIVESPTGSIESLTTNNFADRGTFTPTRLGRYIVALYIDNPFCFRRTTPTVNIDISPPTDEIFQLEDIIKDK